MQPAHKTKHIPILTTHHGFQLAQTDDGRSNGTGLWLGAQCLAAYLSTTKLYQKPCALIELGSGTGLTAFVQLLSSRSSG